MQKFEVDELFLKEDKLLGDDQIRQMMRSGSSQGENPNPQKYSKVGIDFVERPNSVLQQVLKYIKKFEYEPLKQGMQRDIRGPFFVVSEESLYIGEFKQDKRHGRGIQLFKDGCYYEGYFTDDFTNTRGRLVFGDGDMYEGELVDNSMNGHGVYYKRDGSKYTGKFVDDAPEGEGVEEWLDGAKFHGNYLKGSKNGYGVFHFANKSKYEGNFKQDLFWGEGTLTRENGTKYIGNWKDGFLQSPATILTSDGNKYVGEIDKMQQHGQGTQIDKGKEFIGFFKNGKPDGKIKIKDTKDGKIQYAMYKDGKFDHWVAEAGDTSVAKSAAGNLKTNSGQGNEPSKPAKKKCFMCC